MRRLSGALALAILSAGCGGGGGGGGGAEPAAAQLVYSDPVDPGSWRLVRDAASSGTRLVLDLQAPAGSAGRGITLVLSTDPDKVAWEPVDGTRLVKNLAYSGPLVNRASPQGGDLRVLLAQTSGAVVPYGPAPLLSVALSLKSPAAPGALLLTIDQAAHLGAPATPEAITVAVGSLRIQ